MVRLNNFFTEKRILLIIFFLFVIGIILHTYHPLIRITEYTSDAFILTCIGLIFLRISLLEKNAAVFYWFLAISAITLGIEIIGVETGKIFGEYSYGERFKLNFLNVPIVIGFNWAILILGAVSLARYFFHHKIVVMLIASFLVVGFDYVLEPVAILNDYWSWHSDSIPLQNYLAWAVISLVCSFFIQKVRFNKKIPSMYFIFQLVYFVILRLVYAA